MVNKALKNKLIVLPNDDKHFHEECDYEDLGNFPIHFVSFLQDLVMLEKRITYIMSYLKRDQALKEF